MLGHEPRDRVRHGGPVGDVGHERRVRGGLTQVQAGGGPPVRGEELDTGGADAARGPGDQDDGASQRCRPRSPPPARPTAAVRESGPG